tara:strand:- start:196 stop:465 length:270 start_codon:yes stop_codon:yes gene_type:complete
VELVIVAMVVLDLGMDGTTVDLVEVVEDNSLDLVLVVDILEDVLLDNGLLDQLVEVVVDHIMLVLVQQIRQVVIQVILPIHTQEMDILR